MKLAVITGMPGAGKEELLNAAVGLGMPFVRMGDVVRGCYAASDSASKGISVGQFADAQRREFGPDIWAKRVMEKASGDPCLIDGCRSRKEIETFVGLGGEVTVMAVHASPSVRYERLVKRAREDAPKNTDEFRERDSREIGWGVAEVIALADHLVPNMGTLEEFRQASEKVLRSLR